MVFWREDPSCAESLCEGLNLALGLFALQVLQYEKKTLMSQWKSALIGLERRNEALKKLEDSIR